MFENLDCIALRTVRYSDSRNILTAYSRQRGRVTVSIPAGSGRTAMRTRALTMPLSVFQCVADVRPDRDILQIRDMRSAPVSFLEGPVRSTLGLFIADILAALLREPQRDVTLYDFILYSREQIAGASGTALANMHLCFLLRLQHFLGIEPDWSTYTGGAIFDMADGIFRPSAPQFPGGVGFGRWQPAPVKRR